MSKEEIFTSSVRSSGDLAGVFEFDGETGYFYLYDQARTPGQMIMDQIHILSRKPDFAETDVSVQWDDAEKMVALLLRGKIWAVFDVESKAKHGGDYARNKNPTVPPEIADRFTD